MPKKVTRDPWPRLRDVVAAAISGLQDGNFIEETLESLCAQLGAASAWSTLETKGGRGPLHRSRSASFRGVAPAVLAVHVAEVLSDIQVEGKTFAGRPDYNKRGSFIAVPLWSRPAASAKGRTLVGALYLEFEGDQGTRRVHVEFAESVGTLLGGMIAQQTLIEASREDLRVERAMHGPNAPLSLEELLGPPSMHEIAEELRAAMAGNASIMLLGESGTGKTQLATAIARATRREPVVRATLGMADDLNTIASELFGHERGAFSGAISKRKGLVEYADGGTLILDEVLALPRHAQQLLLDFTQFGWYRPLGYQARDPKTAAVRIISVTNGNIEHAVNEGRFREDLYYRLAVVPITLPPLRQRRWEIPGIAVRYLNRTDAQAQWQLDEDANEQLTSPDLPWPGNVRELEAVMERARSRARAAGSEEPLIRASHLGLKGKEAVGAPAVESDKASMRAVVGSAGDAIRQKWEALSERRASIEAYERETIEEALAMCDGTVARTARLLAVPRTGLISRITKLEIDPERFKGRNS